MKEIIQEKRNVKVVIKQSEHKPAEKLGGARRVLLPPPLPLRQSYEQVKYPPFLPTGIGERFSQTISII
jgi:hypothetical protein